MDDEWLRIPQSGAMFAPRSLGRGDLATDLAIEILANGGWPALTLRTAARAANMTPQAIAAWFPSVSVMRAAVAERYGLRWVGERGRLASTRLSLRPDRTRPVTVADVAIALLPTSRWEEAFAGVWLTILEASRWDPGVSDVLADIREREHGQVLDMLARVEVQVDDREALADAVLALVHGLCLARVAPRGAMTAERAEQVVRAVLSDDPT